MTSFPIEILFGISFGLLIGIVPAFLVGTVAYALEYRRGRALPRPLAAGTAIAIAVAYGVLADVFEPAAGQGPRLGAATVVAGLLALYANSQGSRLGSTLSREIYRPTRRERPLSAEAIDSVDGVGQVAIRSTGDVRDVAGYPPLTPDVRDALESGSWRLPADLPLAELETRLADRLRTTHGLATVSVSIDGRGRASIAAAPPENGIADRVPRGWRAISIAALLPTGLAPGDEVIVDADTSTVTGVVLCAGEREDGPRADDGDEAEVAEREARATAHPDGEPTVGRSPVATDGGAGRVTVAVPPADASDLLARERGRVVAIPRDTNPEFDALAHLEAAGRTVRSVSLTDDDRAMLRRERADGTNGSGDDAERAVRLLAVNRSGSNADGHGWTFDPDDDAVDDATEAFVVGTRTDLEERFGDGAEGER